MAGAVPSGGLGAALLGISQGINQWNQTQAQTSLNAQSQQQTIEAQKLQNQESQLTVQAKIKDLSEKDYMDRMAAQFGYSPDDPNPGTAQAKASPGTGAGGPQNQPNPNAPLPSLPPKLAALDAPWSREDMVNLKTADLADARASLAKYQATGNPTQIAAAKQGVDQAQKELAIMQKAAEEGEPTDPGVKTTQAASVENAKEAGQDVSAPQYQTAADAQFKQAAVFDKMADKAVADGQFGPAAKFRAMAMDTRKKAQDYQKETLTIQKGQRDEMKEVLGGLDPAKVTQEQWTSARSELVRNPLFQQRYKALGLTGSVEQDRNKIAQLVSQSETLAQRQAHEDRLLNEKRLEQQHEDVEADKHARLSSAADKQNEKRDEEKYGKLESGHRWKDPEHKELGQEPIPGTKEDPDSENANPRSTAVQKRIGGQVIQIGKDMTQVLDTLAATPFTTESVFGRGDKHGLFDEAIKQYTANELTARDARQMDIIMSGYKRTVGQALGAVGQRGATVQLFNELDALHIKAGDTVGDAQLTIAEGVGLVRNAVESVDTKSLSKEQQEKLADIKQALSKIPTPAEVQSGKYGKVAKDQSMIPTKGPEKGAVQDGYKFKGGDPSKQENWEKV